MELTARKVKFRQLLQACEVQSMCSGAVKYWHKES